MGVWLMGSTGTWPNKIFSAPAHLMFCCHWLEILKPLLVRELYFHFAVVPTKYVASSVCKQWNILTQHILIVLEIFKLPIILKKKTLQSKFGLLVLRNLDYITELDTY
jgi:hypothetical protein